jgi:hypothetical protein
MVVSTSSPRVAQTWALTGGLDGGSGGHMMVVVVVLERDS